MTKTQTFLGKCMLILNVTLQIMIKLQRRENALSGVAGRSLHSQTQSSAGIAHWTIAWNTDLDQITVVLDQRSLMWAFLLWVSWIGVRRKSQNPIDLQLCLHPSGPLTFLVLLQLFEPQLKQACRNWAVRSARLGRLQQIVRAQAAAMEVEEWGQRSVRSVVQGFPQSQIW